MTASATRSPTDGSPVGRLVDEYARGQDVDPAAYSAFIAAYSAAVVGYALLYRRSGRTLPEGPRAGDIALLGTATFKLSRLISKDKVTSALRFPFTRYEGDAPGPEVREEPRGGRLRRRVGELITCPFCVGQWAGTALMGLYLLSPPAGRAVAGLLTSIAVSDGLQYADAALHRTASG
ncbi:MAG TPA: DUF1360 domain-containing protein [Acidimicrobiales bacterium]|nr:DUF1360 domain-containing protein [Acidimicrobiales bacterium]